MSYINKRIVETYTGLFRGLSASNKTELIGVLSKSLKDEHITKDNEFYKSFGAFASENTAEEIIANIRSSRKFSNKEINL